MATTDPRDQRRYLYRPFVFVTSAGDGAIDIEFDWSDTYEGYELGDDWHQAHTDHDEHIEKVDALFGEWLKQRGVWDVSVY